MEAATVSRSTLKFGTRPVQGNLECLFAYPPALFWRLLSFLAPFPWPGQRCDSPVRICLFPPRKPNRPAQGPAARAQSAVQTLIARLRGRRMPEGIVKSNGRIEATQVDVAAKYAGRIATMTVEEGDEVTAGQVVATISSPEYEAQLRGTQAQVLRAKQALAEAVALIAQRTAIWPSPEPTSNVGSVSWSGEI
jgi:multidrug efflux pump subunit AcrA (membrane-fusion protein)